MIAACASSWFVAGLPLGREVHLHDISIGAVGAATIAALVSLFGLILGKEQKTSEFRQAWIDALRAEIAAYSVNVNSIADKLVAKYDSHESKVVALASNYAELNKANVGIRLRVNQAEAPSKDLLCAMDKIEILARSDSDFVSGSIDPLEKQFMSAAQVLLKFEWRRVKRGELTFQIAKWGGLLTFSLLILLTIILWSPWRSEASSPSPTQLHGQGEFRLLLPGEAQVSVLPSRVTSGNSSVVIETPTRRVQVSPP